MMQEYYQDTLYRADQAILKKILWELPLTDQWTCIQIDSVNRKVFVFGIVSKRTTLIKVINYK